MSSQASRSARPDGTPRMRPARIMLLPGAVVVFIALAALAYLAFPVGGVVTSAYTAEAGGPVPPASVFAVKNGNGLRYAGGMDKISMDVPGEYRLTIASGLRRYTCTLIVQDTTPPEADTRFVAVWMGGSVNPNDFLVDISENIPAGAAFLTPPDTAVPGGQEVTLLLTDASGNEARLTQMLYVYDLPEVKNVGMRDAPLTSYDVVPWLTDTPPEDLVMATDVSQINPQIPGVYPVSLSLNGEMRECWLRLFDATPPQADPVNITCWLGDAPEPADFVANVRCDTDYSVVFRHLPDITEGGEYTVTVAVVSAYGPETEVSAQLTVVLDTEPPVISGALEKFVTLGAAAAYRKDITATDNRDGDVELAVDSSAVNLKAPGTYTVVYSATDSSGNKTVAQGSMTVHDITHDMVLELAEGILSSITNADMSPYDKTHAIYKWAKRSISYANGADKSSVDYAAYLAFTAGKGDCYTYYAACEVLLTAAGIENLPIQRSPGHKTRHYWSLVNLGEGWYHFDTTPHKQGGDTFMMTQSQISEHETLRGAGYYDYDETLYPEVAP